LPEKIDSKDDRLSMRWKRMKTGRGQTMDVTKTKEFHRIEWSLLTFNTIVVFVDGLVDGHHHRL